MRVMKLYFFSFIFTLSVAGQNIVKVYLVPDIVAQKKSCMIKTSFNQVYIQKYHSYFLEDYHNYRGYKKNFIENPAFHILNFKNNKLYKHFYIIQNKKDIKEGFYNVTIKILETEKLKTVCIQKVAILQMATLNLDMEKIKIKVKKLIMNHNKKILNKNLYPLFKKHKKVILPELKKKQRLDL